MAASLTLSGISALLSLPIIGILSANVVYFTRLADYHERVGIPGFPVKYELLQTMKLINGLLILLPGVVFLAGSADIGRTAANPTKAAAKAVASSVMSQGKLRRRPILFGTLFSILALFMIAILLTDFFVYGRIIEFFLDNEFPTDYTVPLEALQTIQLVNAYTIILPGIIVVLGMALLGVGIKQRKSAKEEES